MREIIAYIRVSTEGQKGNGAGLQDQMSTISDYAQRHRYQIRSVYSEAASGGGKDLTRGRPELRRALDEAKMHDLPLVVANPSRLTRSMDAMHRFLTKENIQVTPLEVDGKTDPISLQAHAHRDERQRRRNAERTREALAERKRQGVRLGNPTNLPEAQKRGAEANKKKAKAADEIIIPLIMQIHKEGHSGLNAISRRLNELGELTVRGGKWYPATIKKILDRNAIDLSLEFVDQTRDSKHRNHSVWGSW